MKTRNGLVSNSSSSSFIVMGYKISTKITDVKQIIETYAPEALKDQGSNSYDVNFLDNLFYHLWNEHKLFNGVDGVWDSEKFEIYLGVKLAEEKSEEFGIDDKELDITECLKKCEEVRRMLKLPLDQQPKIYTGTRSC
jgi:hypothetical protein